MDGHSARRAINFDLDTNALKEYYCKGTGKDYTQAYADIRKFMTQNGFVHRQGSGYISSDQLDDTEITRLIIQMAKTMPWLRYCGNTMDLTDIGERQDIMDDIIRYSCQSVEQTIDQYSAGISSDGAIIIDEENLRRDHPEINLYSDEPSLQDHIKTQEKRTAELYNKHEDLDQER